MAGRASAIPKHQDAVEPVRVVTEPIEISMRSAERRRKMKAEHAMGKVKHEAPVEDAEALRRRILQVSLFPGIYNKRELLRNF